MENLNEDFEVLEELFRTAYKLISPITYHDDVERLTPEFVQKDYEHKPGCYLKIGNNGLFPICNRYGYKDPQMIKFSLKMAKKMVEKDNGQYIDLSGTIIKLEKLLNKYSKPVPKTNSQAALQGIATKKFNRGMEVSEWGGYDKGYEVGRKVGSKSGVKTGLKIGVIGTVALAGLYKALKKAVNNYKEALTPESRIAARSDIKKIKAKIKVFKKEKTMSKSNKQLKEGISTAINITKKVNRLRKIKKIKKAAKKAAVVGGIGTGAVGAKVAGSAVATKYYKGPDVDKKVIAGGAVGVGAGILLKKLYDKYKKEKDPAKKDKLKAKIKSKIKSKISKNKQLKEGVAGALIKGLKAVKSASKLRKFRKVKKASQMDLFGGYNAKKLAAKLAAKKAAKKAAKAAKWAKRKNRLKKVAKVTKPVAKVGVPVAAGVAIGRKSKEDKYDYDQYDD